MKSSLYRPFLFLLVFTSASAQVPLNPTPSRVVGQVSLSQFSANLVEGREFNTPYGVAVDTTMNPPALYVADTGNNRVLGFRNAATFTPGAKADIVIGQVDFVSTGAQGPGTARAIGLTFPTGLTVDGSGNLYVVDSGNNRILRFPTPFSQTNIFPNLVIGQTSFYSKSPNAGGISSSTLFLSDLGSNNYAAYLAFDANGLWVADAGNNRVLHFPTGQLSGSATPAPVADIVLGQLDFTTNAYGPTDLTSTISFRIPTGITLDASGRLFISESTPVSSGTFSRVLMFSPPFTTGKPATRIIGVVPSTVQPQPPFVSEQRFNVAMGGLFSINNRLGAIDTYNHRLLIYDPADSFTSNVLTQQAKFQFGQSNFSVGLVNSGQPEPTSGTLAYPQSVAVSPTEVYIADTGNNRIIVVPYSGGVLTGGATRLLGQTAFNYNAPNLVEGRELRLSGDAGVVVDWKSSPPHLYVSDPANNRVLGFRDARTVKAGVYADIVIGQPDLLHTEINYPTNSATTPSASSLYYPVGLALDGDRNLYVADWGNGRVLRFPAPFDNPATLPPSNLVLGQSSATSQPIRVATNTTLGTPYGLAFSFNGSLLVSDQVYNRVLLFPGPASSMTTGMAATKVFGQPDFFSSGASSSGSPENNRFSGPRHIATDTDDRLYVADTGNNRVMIFNRAPVAETDPRAPQFLVGNNLSAPEGLYVNPNTGEIWVANAGNGLLQRYSRFINLPLNSAPTTVIQDTAGGYAITQDAFGNLYTADGGNRIIINYPPLDVRNGASFLSKALAPGTIGTIFSQSTFKGQFGSTTQAAPSLPLPTQLGGVQVLFNNQPIPLYYVSPDQINFVMPQSAPTSGTGDLLVINASTSQVLGDFSINLDVASPAIFTNGSGTGQVAAINQDGSINGSDHPAPNNSIVQFFGTGEGVVPNAPADGVAPTAATPTPQTPTVLIGTGFVPAENITYSGLAPGLVGVWQVNVKIPNTVAPTKSTGNITPVVFQLYSINSNGDQTNRISTTMWVSAPQ